MKKAKIDPEAEKMAKRERELGHLTTTHESPHVYANHVQIMNTIGGTDMCIIFSILGSGTRRKEATIHMPKLLASQLADLLERIRSQGKL